MSCFGVLCSFFNLRVTTFFLGTLYNDWSLNMRGQTSLIWKKTLSYAKSANVRNILASASKMTVEMKKNRRMCGHGDIMLFCRLSTSCCLFIGFRKITHSCRILRSGPFTLNESMHKFSLLFCTRLSRGGLLPLNHTTTQLGLIRFIRMDFSYVSTKGMLLLLQRMVSCTDVFTL